MEAILHWGLGAVRAVQGGASPAMVSLMRIASALGSGAALLALVALAYWCVDGKKGLRLGAALLVSAWANLALKFLLDQPRPGFFDPALELAPAGGGGGGCPLAMRRTRWWRCSSLHRGGSRGCALLSPRLCAC